MQQRRDTAPLQAARRADPDQMTEQHAEVEACDVNQEALQDIPMPAEMRAPQAAGLVGVRKRSLDQFAPAAALVHETELARNDPHPEAPHLPISYDSGPPRSVIRFRMLHASSASALSPPGVRVRRPVPMIDLYLKKAFSTRACRW